MDTPTENLIGRTDFGKWTVISYAGKCRNGHYVSDLWSCECECGTKRVLPKGNLVSHRSTQCQACGYKSSSQKRRKPPKPPKPMYTIWSKYRAEMCTEWCDYYAFDAWCNSSRNANILRRHDESSPFSSANCWWSDGYIRGDAFRAKVAALRVKLLGESEDDAREWVLSVCKQRVHTWWGVNKQTN
jgi:hypothetical protein